MLINVDTTNLVGKTLVVQAEAISNSADKNDSDNKVIDTFRLIESSDLVIQGRSSKLQFQIDNEVPDLNITHEIEIFNLGPSNMKELSVIVYLPTTYGVNYALLKRENLTIIAHYKDIPLEMTWYQKNQAIEKLPYTSTSSPELEYIYPIETDALDRVDEHRLTLLEQSQTLRQKRDLKAKHNQEHHSIINELPINRTIQFDCSVDHEDIYSCLEIFIQVKDFQAGNDPVKIKIDFTLDYDSLNQVFKDNIDNFAMKTNVMLKKPNDEGNQEFQIKDESFPFTIIFKYRTKELPWWILVAAIIAGTILLFILTFALYKCGFFKREKKEELERLTKNEV